MRLSASISSRVSRALVARFRYHLQVSGGSTETILCEEIVPLVCTGSADAPQWLPSEKGEALLLATPERNLIQTAIDQQLGLLLPSLAEFQRRVLGRIRRLTIEAGSVVVTAARGD